MAQRPYPAPKWLIEGLLPGGGWTLVIAKGKVGKSLFVAQLLHALSEGEPFWGRATPTPTRCVMIQADTPPAVWQDELAQAGFPTTSRVSVLFVEPGCLSGEISPLLTALEPVRPCYVAFDALDSLFMGQDVNDPNHVKGILSRLRRIAQSPAFCLIHHSRKGSPGEEEDLRDAAAGSRVLLNRADHVIYLRSTTGPIEITGRLAFYTFPPRHLRRLPGGRWEAVS